MPNQTIEAFDLETRGILGDKGAGPAAHVAGGLPSTTAVKTGSFPRGTKTLYLEAHNAGSSATTVEYALNPYLTVLRTQDFGATFTDYSEHAQDDNLSNVIVLDSQNTAANGDALFVGSHVPFRGVAVDVSAANGTGSRTLTVRYWNGTAWTDTSDSDGTSSSTSLDQDGDVTWSVPSAWTSATLRSIIESNLGADAGWNDSTFAGTGRAVNNGLYWTRWEWSGALDSEVELASMLALNRSTAYSQLVVGGAAIRRALHRGPGGFGSIEYNTDTGTADLIAVAGSGNGYFGS